MKDIYYLSTRQDWKAYSHPLRQQQLLLLCEKEMTNAELANSIGVAPGRLHFHTGQLLDAGLIEIAGTREKGPITEKLYRASARRYESKQAPEDIDRPLASTFETGKDLYLRRGHGSTDSPMTGTCLAIPMSRQTALAFMARLEQLQEELLATKEDDEVDGIYAVTLVMHRLATDETTP